MIRATGSVILGALEAAGFSLNLMGASLARIGSFFSKFREILHQAWLCGVVTLPVTFVVATFSGFILALQAGLALRDFGQQDVIGGLVSVVMFREFGPFMTASILGAMVGSSMAAEVGTMKVSEEIDALEVMSIDVPRFIVFPRLMAMIIMTPVLTALTNVIGTLGGAIIGYTQLGVDFRVYYDVAVENLDFKDVWTGMSKSVVFGIIIATVGCSQGLRTTGGAMGVGRATRAAVVISYLLIIIIGFFMTAVYYR